MNSFLKYLPALLLYFTLSGGLWHLGFWATFKINYLEFINVADVFKSTIFPFLDNVWPFISFILPIAVWGITIIFHDNSKEKKHAKVVTYPVLILLMMLFSLVISIFSGIYFTSEQQWRILPISLAFFIGTILFAIDFLKSHIYNEISRYFILVGFAMFPCLNFGISKLEALDIKNMTKYDKVINVNSSDSSLIKNLENTAFLGTTSEYLFFYDSLNVIIVKSENIKSFSINHVVK
ncbi:MAG TPA: hypothetical protein PLU37_14670 [Chitinophagaceae bacterium]|nr:hypothetical protein [Chitinophagales bacterium]HPG12774.1 hypothetical protein [Chitinophagaceae bacterium]